MHVKIQASQLKFVAKRDGVRCISYSGMYLVHLWPKINGRYILYCIFTVNQKNNYFSFNV